ncbi:MAG: cell division protein FtsZ [Christensenellaceae bacterium]|jgi:cell division protein FtsZ|nr:cell division protein FtsZ [Christensenellaceae bacterium]
MEKMFSVEAPVVRIKVFGVGGAGNSGVRRMVEDGSRLNGVELYALNTDMAFLQDVEREVGNKITTLCIGRNLCGLQGAGTNPELGQRAAMESKEEIRALMEGADMIFITAGMGGGTGTGASPVIASIAHEMGVLVVGVVSKPFDWEGDLKMHNAITGINNLQKFVDALIVVPNQKLYDLSTQKLGIVEGYKRADEILRQGVIGTADLIVTTFNVHNLDFADVKMVLKNAGVAHMGIGRERTLLESVSKAISSPLLETSIRGASKIILSFKSSEDMSMQEIGSCVQAIGGEARPGCNIKFGAHVNKDVGEKIEVMIIASGFVDEKEKTVEQQAIPETPNNPNVVPIRNNPKFFNGFK